MFPASRRGCDACNTEAFAAAWKPRPLPGSRWDGARFFSRKSSRSLLLFCSSGSGLHGRCVCSRLPRPRPRKIGSREKAGRNRLPSFPKAARSRILGTSHESQRRTTMNQLTCSSAERPARAIPLPGFEEVLPIPAETSRSNLSAWLIAQGYDGQSGKMCPVYFQAGPEKILPASYRCCADGKSKSPKEAGASVESSCLHRDALEWRGESLTLNIPEFPNFRGRSRSEGDVSSLSDILIRGSIPQRYYLTARCAEGILRRAERRGKPLPPVLKEALIRQSQSACAEENPVAVRAL